MANSIVSTNARVNPEIVNALMALMEELESAIMDVIADGMGVECDNRPKG